MTVEVKVASKSSVVTVLNLHTSSFTVMNKGSSKAEIFGVNFVKLKQKMIRVKVKTGAVHPESEERELLLEKGSPGILAKCHCLLESGPQHANYDIIATPPYPTHCL